MNDVKPSEIIILVSGAVLLIFSFVEWAGEGGVGHNAWSGDFGMSWFPLLTWPAILGAAAAILLALTKFANVSLPDQVIGFTWPQLYIVAGFNAVLITLGYLIAGDFLSIGTYLSLLGAIGLLVGAVMLNNETGASTSTGPGSAPPQPF